MISLNAKHHRANHILLPRVRIQVQLHTARMAYPKGHCDWIASVAEMLARRSEAAERESFQPYVLQVAKRNQEHGRVMDSKLLYPMRTCLASSGGFGWLLRILASQCVMKSTFQIEKYRHLQMTMDLSIQASGMQSANGCDDIVCTSSFPSSTKSRSTRYI